MPVSGSITGMRFPDWSKLREKSPIRSARLGTVSWARFCGVLTPHCS